MASVNNSEMPRSVLGVAGLALLVGVGVVANDYRDAPETLVGFDAYVPSYIFATVDIPTKGDIIEVATIHGEDYQVDDNESDCIATVTGLFEYRIRPSFAYSPMTPSHTDFHGNSLDRTDYTTDRREGTVSFVVEDPCIVAPYYTDRQVILETKGTFNLEGRVSVVMN